MGRRKRERPLEPPLVPGRAGELTPEERAAAYINETFGDGKHRREGERRAYDDVLVTLRAVAETYAVDAPERDALRKVARVVLRRRRMSA